MNTRPRLPKLSKSRYYLHRIYPTKNYAIRDGTTHETLHRGRFHEMHPVLIQINVDARKEEMENWSRELLAEAVRFHLEAMMKSLASKQRPQRKDDEKLEIVRAAKELLGEKMGHVE
jgi:hypothetical protein